MRRIALCCCLSLFLLSACDRSDSPQPQPVSTPPQAGTELFTTPLSPQLFELPSEALAAWRSAAPDKPALLLFSFDPLLNPLDPKLRDRAHSLAASGSAAQLRQHGNISCAEPLILPHQAVAAALDAALFSKVYWVFPSKIKPAQLDLAQFRKQMLEQGILTESEVESLSLQNNQFSGSVRGVPFYAIHYQQLARISEPLVLHLDLSFFRSLSDPEMMAPIYTQLRNFALQVRELKLQPLVTSLSFSTLDGTNPLDLRFVLNDLAMLLRRPVLLDGAMPEFWQQRAALLHAGDMDNPKEQNRLAQQNVADVPQSAVAHYDLFQTLFLAHKTAPALKALRQAVVLEPGYAAAYIQLIQMAITDNQLDQALELMELAESQFPENPQLPLQKAQLLNFLKRNAEARTELAKLPKHWSPVFHPQVPQLIKEMQKP